MIDAKIAMKGMNQWSDGLRSKIFINSIKPFADNINNSLKKGKQDTAVLDARNSIDKTIAELSDKQSEALIFESILLDLIRGNITEQKATEILDKLGYKINPNPLAWLKEKIGGLREWIIDAITWLRNVGQMLGLTIKDISVEIVNTPKVTFSFSISVASL